MVSVFDLEQLESLLQDFHRITGIRITVFDAELSELVSYPQSCAAFCRIIRSCPQGRAGCAVCDREACAVAARENRTHIYRCHAGLTEAVTPLYVGRVLVGYLLFGHVFGYEDREEGWEIIRDACSGYPVDPEALKKSCEECPQVSLDYIRAAARILHAIAFHLVRERMATLREDSDAARLDNLLSANFTGEITAQGLCRELGLGRSKLYKLAKQLYGCGISQQVRQMRMELARNLLLDHPEMSIGQIAAECGYEDYNYFIAVFSRSAGESPGAYRNRVRRSAGAGTSQAPL